MADLTKGNWTPYPQPPALVDPVAEARKALRQAISARGDNTIAPYHSPSHTCDRSIAALESAIRQQAQQDHDRLLSEHRAMREALTEAEQLLTTYVDAAGPCDHSVGICLCGDYRTLDDLRATLAGVTR